MMINHRRAPPITKKKITTTVFKNMESGSIKRTIDEEWSKQQRKVCIVGADFDLAEGHTGSDSGVGGGAGHVARELSVQLILDEDCHYHVVVLLADMKQEHTVRFWRHVKNRFPEKLLLQEVGDLTKEQSRQELEKTFRGCSSVFHIIAPDLLPDQQMTSEQVDRHVSATRNIVQALVNQSVSKYVQLTPLTMCVDFTRPEALPSVIKETSWLGQQSPEQEEVVKWCKPDKLAREMLRDSGVLMISIHSGIIMGPLIPKPLHRDSEEFRSERNNDILLGNVGRLMRSIMSGEATYAPNYVAGFVSVVDVAHFMILADQREPMGRNIGENDRFVLSATTESFTDMCHKLKQYFENYDIPKGVSETASEKRKTFEVDGNLVRELLGMRYDLPHQFLKEMGADLLDLKFVKRRPIIRYNEEQIHQTLTV